MGWLGARSIRAFGGCAMRYLLFGRSGLRVSELCLGAMTFGGGSGWTSDAAESRAMFDAFAEAGGTFIDTANVYTGGESETLVGEFVRADRDRFVVATKYTQGPTSPRPATAAGNGQLGRAQPAAAEARADRPLLAAPVGLHHAGRRGDARLRRPRLGRQGPLCRRVRHPRLGGQPRQHAGRPARLVPRWRGSRSTTACSNAPGAGPAAHGQVARPRRHRLVAARRRPARRPYAPHAANARVAAGRGASEGRAQTAIVAAVGRSPRRPAAPGQVALAWMRSARPSRASSPSSARGPPPSSRTASAASTSCSTTRAAAAGRGQRHRPRLPPRHAAQAPRPQPRHRRRRRPAGEPSLREFVKYEKFDSLE